MKAVHHLEVILKTSSRCNINCTYCYYFNGADDSWQTRSKKISLQTLHQLCQYLKKAIQTHGLTSIQIDFHGGEPLLQGKKAFNEMCVLLRQELDDLTKLNFALQTNATLIDDGWVELFAMHNVSVSVSLDGPKTINDAYRLDHQGHSTYDKTVGGIKRLQVAEQEKRIHPISLLSVIHPWAHGERVYRFLVDDLKIKSLDFLLPAKNYHDIKKIEVKQVGRFMQSVWQEWVQDDNPAIRVRFFEAFFASLGGLKSFLYPSVDYGQTGRVAMTVETDGRVFGDDSLRSNKAWQAYPELKLQDSTFSDFLKVELEWHQRHAQVPTKCQGCLWEKVCGGGQLEHRYTEEDGYNNPSAYCHALQELYSEILSYLYHHGMTQEQIHKALAA